MPNYEKLYYHLFGHLSTVLEQLEQQNYGTAKGLLIQILTEAEETYLNEDEETSTRLPI